MAALNSLTYLVYSALALAANNKTTDPYLKALEIGSESQVTDTWNQDYVTRRYNEESCPGGETWSDCNAGCQETCENVGKDYPCFRMCVPGCICEAPGAVRDKDNNCIPAPLCREEDTCPEGETWSDCNAGCQETCETVGKDHPCIRMCVPGCICEAPGAVRDKDNNCIPAPLCQSADVDPDEPYKAQIIWPAEQDPDHQTVDPDEPYKAQVIWPAEQDPDHARVDPDEPYKAQIIWPAEQDPDHARVDPDEPSKAQIIWPAEQDPDHTRGKLNSGGCPKTNECSENCRKQHYAFGLCLGLDSEICMCYHRMKSEDPNFPEVDPDELFRTERYPDDERVDADEPDRAERYPDDQTVDPDEAITTEQDYEVTKDVDPRCPPNEVYSKCETHSGSEDNRFGPVTIFPEVCILECVCKPGFVRGRHGSCIKPRHYSTSNDE